LILLRFSSSLWYDMAFIFNDYTVSKKVPENRP